MSHEQSEPARRDLRQLRAQFEANPDASRVLHQFGAWFVTDYGVEGLREGGIYHIAAQQLWEGDARGSSWEEQLLAEAWMTDSDAADMRHALHKGREVHAAHKST